MSSILYPIEISLSERVDLTGVTGMFNELLQESLAVYNKTRPADTQIRGTTRSAERIGKNKVLILTHFEGASLSAMTGAGQNFLKYMLSLVHEDPGADAANQSESFPAVSCSVH